MVFLLQDGQTVAKTAASGDGRFSFAETSLSPGEYVFGVYAVSKDGSRTPLRTVALRVAAGAMTDVSGLLVTAASFLDRAAALRYAASSDLNKDGKIDLIDFSVLAYWYGRMRAPASVDLSGDGTIDLSDFSILAYYWTD
jgi:hypothetical protein